jgi:hypothetical protein
MAPQDQLGRSLQGNSGDLHLHGPMSYGTRNDASDDERDGEGEDPE